MTGASRQKRLQRLQEAQEREQEAVLGNRQHKTFRKLQDLAMRRRRSTQSLGERVDKALSLASQLSDVSAATLGRESARQKSDSTPPPRTNGALYSKGMDSVAEAYSRRLNLLITALEREVDGHRMRPLVGEYVQETTEEAEKRLIEDYEGIPTSEVIFLDPSWGRVKNPARAIDRVRAKHNQDSNGNQQKA